jgi:hypothetical protein
MILCFSIIVGQTFHEPHIVSSMMARAGAKTNAPFAALICSTLQLIKSMTKNEKAPWSEQAADVRGIGY